MFKKYISLVLLFTTGMTLAKPITLHAIEENISIHGKSSKVFNIVQVNKTEGYIGFKDSIFDVILKNDTHKPISIHWHGLILPNSQDGVPYVTQLPITPGESHHYRFKIQQSGTFWMHSHYGFHEQELMTAPLILKSKHDPYLHDKEVTVMLQGFTFKRPEKILFALQHPQKMKMMSKPDLNDVVFDAYLANRKTLRHPEIVYVKPNETVRLRLINASTATNFWILTGQLKGKAIAVDGNNITPIHLNRYQLAIAQRMDIEVTIPKLGGAFPILAQVEGRTEQTGIILATQNAAIPKLNENATNTLPALNDQQEFQLHALNRLSIKPASTILKYTLTGDMQHYIWKINNEVWPHIHPLKINKGARVEMIFTNNTEMSHPMHLHGHVFQVSEINGKKIPNGPLRDTILVMPHSTKKIIFDAQHPGIWMMHCHVLYHMAAGMMTTINYISYPEPDFYQKLLGLDSSINSNDQ